MQGSSIIRNTSSLFIAQIAGRALSFVLTIILPQYLEGGFDDLGKYFFALWLAYLLIAFMDLGLHTPLIREVAADRSKASQMISNALVIRLILSLINFLIIVALVKFIYSGEMAPLIYLVGIAEIINALARLLRCIYRSFERMGFEAIVVLLERFAVFSLGLYVVIRGYGVVGFCWVVLSASILNLVLSFLIMRWKFSRLDFSLLDVKVCTYLLRQALPFALGGALSMVYFRIDGLMLKHIMGEGGNEAMGWYGTGYNFITTLAVIPGVFMGAVFPVMSRMFKTSPAAMNFLYTKSLKLMFMIALPIAVGVTFMADRIVLILYPLELGNFTIQDQEALSRILEILIWGGALIFFSLVLSAVLRAANKGRVFLTTMGIAVAANIGSNLILIPRYGHLAPPMSIIISESIFFICGLWYIQRHICKLSELGFIFKTAFASGFLALGLIIWKYAGFSESVHIALVVCLSVIAYLAIMLALRGINREDIAMIKGQYPGVRIGE